MHRVKILKIHRDYPGLGTPRLAPADQCKEFPRDRQSNVAVSAFFKSFRVIVQWASMMVAFGIASGPTHESFLPDP
jgi:hypothetical protein